MHMPSPFVAIDPPPAGALPGDRGGLSITTTTITVTTRPVRPVVFA